ncbi:ArsR/SmtB family transcription factor [Streptomyces cyaneofuscatus]
MLRIHFGSADLGRLRLAPQPDVMWETVLSLHQLLAPDPFFAPWSRLARKALAAAGLGREAHLLTVLAPASSYFPDFLTPPGHTTAFEAGVEEVLSTGARRLRSETDTLAGTRSRPSAWLDDIGAGRPRALRHLGDALHRYHAAVLAPYAPEGAECAGREATRHAGRTLELGGEALLSGLGPGLRWLPPVLEVDYPVSRVLELDGRGLLLIPSFFCHNRPVAFADPELPPVLIYPVARGPLWIPRAAHGAPSGHALEVLIGTSRAAALRCLTTGHSTTALAAQLCTSVATASRHATALRRAGLVVTERLGSSVLHSRTPLGTALVHGG